MKVRHLNCGTMCPRGARMLAGSGGVLEPARLVAHCLLIESGQGLVLVDTGFGTGDVTNPARLGQPFRALIQPECRMGETAIRQVEELGLNPADVRDIVVTHLDVDHAGGLGDFPEARVHVFGPELDAAVPPSLRDRARYRPAHFAHGPRWERYEVAGDDWFGFESVRLLPGLEAEVALVPLVGHSAGHSAIAVNGDGGWLLHCGDAFFFRGEIETPPRCPHGLRVFQALTNHDGATRRHNQDRLRELAREHGDEVTLFCSHDPEMLAAAS